MLLFEKESYELIGAGMAVHRELSNGYLEAVYQEAFAVELEERGIPHELEEPREDERKAVQSLKPEQEAQVLNYLRTTGCKLGLLFNFGATSFQHKRLAL